MFGRAHKRLKSCGLWFMSAALAFYGIPAQALKNKYSNASPIIENVSFEVPICENSTKKITRTGILVRYKGAVGTILVAHGYMCNKYDVGFLRNLFPSGKFNILTFDFRAHGDGIEGQACTLGKDEALDVIAAATYLRSHPDLTNKPLFAYAFSMGAVATIEAQAKDASLFDALILDCPFDSSENMLKKCVDNLKFSLFGYEFNIPGRTILQKYAFHPYVQSILKMLLKTVANMETRQVETVVHPVYPVKSVAKISVPCFFIHCKNDEKVSISSVKSIFEKAAGPKKLWLTNGRRHYDSFFYNPEGYIEKVRDFLDQVLAGQLKKSNENQIITDAEELLNLTTKNDFPKKVS